MKRQRLKCFVFSNFEYVPRCGNKYVSFKENHRYDGLSCGKFFDDFHVNILPIASSRRSRPRTAGARAGRAHGVERRLVAPARRRLRVGAAVVAMLGVAPAVAVVALLVHERGVVRARGAAAELVRVGQESDDGGYLPIGQRTSFRMYLNLYIEL